MLVTRSGGKLKVSCHLPHRNLILASAAGYQVHSHEALAHSLAFDRGRTILATADSAAWGKEPLAVALVRSLVSDRDKTILATTDSAACKVRTILATADSAACKGRTILATADSAAWGKEPLAVALVRSLVSDRDKTILATTDSAACKVRTILATADSAACKGRTILATADSAAWGKEPLAVALVRSLVSGKGSSHSNHSSHSSHSSHKTFLAMAAWDKTGKDRIKICIFRESTKVRKVPKHLFVIHVIYLLVMYYIINSLFRSEK